MASKTGDWVHITDTISGSAYYANTTTRETSWVLPQALGGSVAPLHVKLSGGWYQYEDDATGRLYYYCTRTGKSTWTLPDEARLAADRDGSVFVQGMRDEEGEGEEEEDEDDDEYFVDEAELLDEDDDAGSSLRSSRRGSNASLPEGEVVPVAAGSEAAPVAPPRPPRISLGGDAAARAKAAEHAEKRAARRLRILEEILLSERTYVQALMTLRKVYLDPLRMVSTLPAGKGQIFTNADIDVVFINIELIIRVNGAFLEELETELELRRGHWPSVEFGAIIQRAAKQFKGCYTRYVTQYDASAARLQKLEDSDKDKARYLEVCKTHPDSTGLDVRSFLIQPVQRVPRYRMLLEDLLKHTDPEHADEAPLRESLARVCEVAMHINEEKRHLDEVERMRQLVCKFQNGAAIEKELVSYERRVLKEGRLSKLRRNQSQTREVFLCSDVILYAARPTMPSSLQAGAFTGLLTLKGKIWLHDGARIQLVPSTQNAPHAFAVVARGGKGYTWLAESAEERDEWFAAISKAISDTVARRKNKAGGAGRAGDAYGARERREANQKLALVPSKPLNQRLDVVTEGTLLTKYNLRDGKASFRWVKLSLGDNKLSWGDPKTRECKSDVRLSDATALLHGAKGSAFYKMRQKKALLEAQCFSIVFKERTLDFAAESPALLLDWYLALAEFIPHSTEPLLSEEELRKACTNLT